MISVNVTEASQVAEARRRASALAVKLGFDEAAVGRVALATTELATNLVKYGTRGEIVLASYEEADHAGVEIVSLDRGAGLASVENALSDGSSTGGTAGHGLGAVKRQAHAFDIASWPGHGVAVFARFGPRRPGPATIREPLAGYGSISVPLRGEAANGDAACFRRRDDGWTLIVADGLGHGPNAAQASEAAVRLFRDHEHGSPAEILMAIHAGLRHTRGGAVAVGRYDSERGVLTFCGIGNVAGTVVNAGKTNGTVSMPGTVGHIARRFQEFEYPLAPGGLCVMHSDGVGTSWKLGPYPGILAAHPGILAAVLYRDYGRPRDDATVAVARAKS